MGSKARGLGVGRVRSPGPALWIKRVLGSKAFWAYTANARD